MLSSDCRLILNENLTAGLSELELSALDVEDAILDLRAFSCQLTTKPYVRYLRPRNITAITFSEEPKVNEALETE